MTVGTFEGFFGGAGGLGGEGFFGAAGAFALPVIFYE